MTITSQEKAQAADSIFTGVFNELEKIEDVDHGAIVAGAMTAVVRYTIRKLILPPAVPTVRGVFDLLIKPMNESAAQLTPKPKKGKASG